MKTFITICLIMLFSFLVLKDKPVFVDEYQHYETIKEIASFQINENTFVRNAPLPGYFLVIGFLKFLFRVDSLAGTRLISLIFSIFSIFTFYLLAKTIEPKSSLLKTWQYFFFPLIFLFFFLIYTDVFSLWLIMLSFYFLIKGRYRLSCLIGVLSVFIKQSNIVWLGFFCFYLLIEKYWPLITWPNLLSFVRKIWIYLLAFLGFAIFVFLNQGVTIGEANKAAVPISIYFDNIYLFLFLFFFLFLPFNIVNLPKILKLVKDRPIGLLLLLALFFFYLATFKVDHYWNVPAFNFFLRNALLNWAISSLTNKILFFLPIAYSLLSLAVTPLPKKAFYALYPFTLFFLSLSWLIEQRYYLIPLTLFILFKKQASPIVEYATLAIYVFFSAFFFLGVINQSFFL